MLVKSKVDLVYYNKGCAISRAIGRVETLPDCPSVTLSRTDLGRTLSTYPVYIEQSLLIPKLNCDEVRGLTMTHATLWTAGSGGMLAYVLVAAEHL